MPATPANAMEETDRRFVIYNVDWRFYETLLKALGDRHIFVTYDRGNLELMSPSPEHEWGKTVLRRMIESVAFELQIQIRSGGSMTLRREDLDRGLEPDECYYIMNAPLLDNIRAVDLRRHPPPDLALEIDVSRSSLDRQAIYAAFGVPEIWRYDGKTLRVHTLSRNRKYKLSGRSLNFPSLPLREIQRFLEAARGAREVEWLRSFRQWVRDNLKRP